MAKKDKGEFYESGASVTKVTVGQFKRSEKGKQLEQIFMGSEMKLFSDIWELKAYSVALYIDGKGLHLYYLGSLLFNNAWMETAVNDNEVIPELIYNRFVENAVAMARRQLDKLKYFVE